MRALNSMERQAVESIILSSNTDNAVFSLDTVLRLAKVDYSNHSGNFCICVLAVKRNIYVGASRRSYKDRPNKVRGEMLAFSKAVKALTNGKDIVI